MAPKFDRELRAKLRAAGCVFVRQGKQVKRYAPDNPVGAGIVRDFFGSLDRFRATKGLIITTSFFTRDAIETTNHLSKRMVLIDGDLLAGLMVRHNVGCRIDETIYIKKIDEDFFES